MKEVLDDRLRRLASDTLMVEAIKYLFNELLEKDLPLIDSTNDNSLLGEKYRAYVQSKHLIDNFIARLGSLGDEKTNNETINLGK